MRRFNTRYRKDGTKKKYPYPWPLHQYTCKVAQVHTHEKHPKPYSFSGRELDWAVWRHLVDRGITQPDLIKMQILVRQEELQKQGESVDGDIAHARRRLSEVDGERSFYQRQGARGQITEREFDARMAETEETARYWQVEIKRLTELRDDAERVQAGLSYMEELLGNVQSRLPELDWTPEELAQLPDPDRRGILEEQKKIVQALVQKVTVWANGHIKVTGILDGSEGTHFDMVNSPSPRSTLRWPPRGRPCPAG